MSKIKVAGSRDANLKDKRTSKEVNGVFLLVRLLRKRIVKI